MSSTKGRLFSLGLNELNVRYNIQLDVLCRAISYGNNSVLMFRFHNVIDYKFKYA